MRLGSACWCCWVSSRGDTQDDVVWMANKVVGLRVFEDDDGKMNLDVGEVGGAVLAVSQFTLLGDCRKGRRPSFVAAARPEEANGLYRGFVTEVAGQGLEVQGGPIPAAHGCRVGQRWACDLAGRQPQSSLVALPRLDLKKTWLLRPWCGRSSRQRR